MHPIPGHPSQPMPREFGLDPVGWKAPGGAKLPHIG
ncbi:hypothetical protein BSE24067_02623 [Burkholderia seminalis]|nr:hypothetical protein BSE24067_02623 [Burkholderia seminalis]